MRRVQERWWLVFLLGALVAPACGDDDDATGGEGEGEGEGEDPFERNEQGQVLCDADVACLCDNGIDDDGDGAADGADSECTGPYDDDESSFATGIPGDNIDEVFQDCFFDGNSGHGDDGCRVPTECVTDPNPAENPDCDVSQECLDFCVPRTPNGCDCFGCCDVVVGDQIVSVRLEGTCSLEVIGDPELCPPCVQNEDCGDDDCTTCELCAGRTLADLPPECFDDGGGVTCDTGREPCDDAGLCPQGYFCQQGCCLLADVF